jgi:chemotaxis signal transduction protein/HPt (histidine-containing phosphotransfer) domain-containing protein
MGEFDDIIPEYLTESRELLETVESGFLALENGAADDETVHTVFRAIHSIKGGAGFVGLAKIERLAHKMEDLLNLIRNHDLAPSPPVTDALLQSFDVLTELFERVDEHEAIDIEGPLRALVAALEAGVDQGLRSQIQQVGASNPESGLPEFEVSEYTLANKLKQGNIFFIRLEMDQIEARGVTPIQLVNEMLSMGELLDSKVDLPAVGDPSTYEVRQVRFNVLYATVLEADLLASALGLSEDALRLLNGDDFGLGQAATAAAEPPPPQTAAQPSPPPASTAAPAAKAKPAPAQAPPDATASAPVPARPEAPAPAQAVQPSKGGEYLTFNLGRETFGVDILCVQEIIGLPRLTRLPRSPEHVLGVMNLRGMVVPVLDMRQMLHLAPREGDEPVAVVLMVGEKIMAAVVDAVSDVVQIKEEQVQEAPDFAGPVRRDYVRGLCRHEQAMIILLELDRLLMPEAMGYAA